MATFGETPRRNSQRSTTNYLCIGLLFLLLCDVPTLVDGCKSWEKCLTVSECRKIQKQNNIKVGRITDFSFVFPCDESLDVMTVCCATQRPGGQQVVEQHPGYNITYGDPEESRLVPVNAPPLPVPLPLKVEGLKVEQEQTESRDTETCGLSRGGGLGGDATRGQFPWLALLGKCDDGTEDFLVDCGGSLISNQHVLTSAHCLDGLKAPPKFVRLGVYDRSLKKFQSNASPQQYGIEKIIVHERFNFPVLKNDIALVRLEKPVPQFSDWLRPICLPEAPSSELTQYIVAGWRTHGSRGLASTTIPKFGQSSLNNSGLCDLPIPLQPIAETQMCFGSNPSSCFGDFGGPLMEVLKTGTTERAVQVALFSYGGSQCNAKFSADLYTKIFPFREWIMKNMNS
ncbi:venom protease-like [Hetaerina americana]|uniref:venom protease-like n=1 Tax=Hetaerina americana TaxID=62018 RepID=UPI003A7F4E1D